MEKTAEARAPWKDAVSQHTILSLLQFPGRGMSAAPRCLTPLMHATLNIHDGV